MVELCRTRTSHQKAHAYRPWTYSEMRGGGGVTNGVLPTSMTVSSTTRSPEIELCCSSCKHVVCLPGKQSCWLLMRRPGRTWAPSHLRVTPNLSLGPRQNTMRWQATEAGVKGKKAGEQEARERPLAMQLLVYLPSGDLPQSRELRDKPTNRSAKESGSCF